MKTILLVRGKSTDQGTPGVLTLPDASILHSIELPYKANHQSFSCVPLGDYVMVFTTSQKFPSGTWELTKVSGRDGIRIHSGNWAGDITIQDDLGLQIWASDVEGCILLGTDKGMLENKFKHNQQAVLHSKIAIGLFESRLVKDKAYLLSIKEQS